MIVKVQVSQFDSEDRKMMLIYNESRTVIYEVELTKEVEVIMQGELKRFFHASFKRKTFKIETPAPYQNW